LLPERVLCISRAGEGGTETEVEEEGDDSEMVKDETEDCVEEEDDENEEDDDEMLEEAEAEKCTEDGDTDADEKNGSTTEGSFATI
jgi:hypothetical protein